MRYLVISDLHANLEALETVLAAEPPDSYGEVLLLGDLVGYGADPNAVIDRVRELDPRVLIRGNHDKVASGVEDAQSFNSLAREAVRWTYRVLRPENREYLANLPMGPVEVDDVVEVCHGTPYDEDAYVFDDLDALRALKSTEHRVCLFGHTHIPAVFVLLPERFEVVIPDGSRDTVLKFVDQCRYLINPGSVGQPRDGDPRAAYAVLDTDRMEIVLKRREYPVEQAQAKISAAGLPEPLALRLSLGR